MFWKLFFQKNKVAEIHDRDADEEEEDDTQEIYESTEQLITDNDNMSFKIVYEKIVVHTEKSIEL